MAKSKVNFIHATQTQTKQKSLKKNNDTQRRQGSEKNEGSEKRKKRAKARTVQRNNVRLCCSHHILHWKIPARLCLWLLENKAPGHFHFPRKMKRQNERKMNDTYLPSIDTIFGWLFHFTLIIISLAGEHHSFVCVHERHLQPTGTSLTRRFAAMNNERLSNHVYVYILYGNVS